MTVDSENEMDGDEAPREIDYDDNKDENDRVCLDYHTPETVCAIAPDDEEHMLSFVHIVGRGIDRYHRLLQAES